MTRYEAHAQTELGSRYLQQLCKHWSHRFEVSFDPSHGVVRLPAGDCVLDADDKGLRVAVEGADADALPRLCEVVAEHLKRFSFREPLDLSWEKVAG